MPVPQTLPSESLYVTAAAARAYQKYAGPECGAEEARRELLQLLLGAKRVRAEPGNPASYRSRSRSTKLDVTAQVIREGDLLVVVAALIREYR